MSGSSNNSWTIVTPEETAVAETLRPLTQGTERQDEPSAPTDGLDSKPSEAARGLFEEDHPISVEENVVKPNEDSDASSLPSSDPSKVQSSPVPELQTEETPQASGLSSTEPESFSDSYTHLGPSLDESPAPALAAETLGHLDSGQEGDQEAREQTDVQDETQHHTVRQDLQPEEEEPEEEPEEKTQQWSPLETPQDPTVQSQAPEAELELRRRRLAALEKIGRHDEEEEAEEDFHVPQRDEDSGITLNKCILGAVILLGLGTIFISGVFMDLDEENDYPPVELKDSESSGKQAWLNPDISQPGVEAGSAELLNKLTKGNEQIEMLQAQLQSQNEELKVAKAQAAEGSTERLEEVHKENSRLMESVPVLQKELEKMRTELESVSVLQKEVETLRSQLKFFAAATTPPSGKTEDSSHRPEDYEVHKKEKHDRGVTKEWKDAEKSKWKKEEKQRKDEGKREGKEKEWKKEKSERDKFDKRQKEDKHSRQSDEMKEWKKDKSKKGDEGKPWKEKKEKKEWTYEGDKKHKYDHFKEEKRSKEERDFKESKYYQEKHKGPGDKRWKNGREEHKEEKREWSKEGDKKHKRDKFKEERDFKEGKYYQEKHKGDKHWKNERDDYKEERKEKKQWKERDGYESQNRKDDGERREKSKEQKKWNKEDKKEWMKEEEKTFGGEKKYQREWHGDKFEKHDKRKDSEHEDHTWTEKKPAHSHPKPTMGQPEYWSRQRERVQHSSKPRQNCDSPDSCAQAEGVRPVPFAEFESILKNYLSKAQTAGVEASQIDELQKLASEVFQSGVFPHDTMSFQDFVEDVGDILEDLVEGEDENEKDLTIEDEMEGFEEEVMQKFMLSGEKEGG